MKRKDNFLLTILVWGFIAAMLFYSCGLGGLLGGPWR